MADRVASLQARLGSREPENHAVLVLPLSVVRVGIVCFSLGLLLHF